MRDDQARHVVASRKQARPQLCLGRAEHRRGGHVRFVNRVTFGQADEPVIDGPAARPELAQRDNLIEAWRIHRHGGIADGGAAQPPVFQHLCHGPTT